MRRGRQTCPCGRDFGQNRGLLAQGAFRQRVFGNSRTTREAIDPFRFLSNYSSGKMGCAIAQTAAHLGAEVVLISGPTNLPCPQGVQRISVESAAEMYQAVLHHFPNVDVVVRAAAVSDCRAQPTAPRS